MALPVKYKKLIEHYTYRIEWDAEDKIYVVSVEELSGCMTHGDTPLKALKMGYEAVEGYLESMYKHNEDIPLPLSLQKFSGEFMVRGEPKLHSRLVAEANRAGISLNKLVIAKLEKSS